MAHVHGSAAKQSVSHAAHAAHSAHAHHGAAAAHHAHGAAAGSAMVAASHTMPVTPRLAAGGAAVAAGSSAGHGVLGRFLRHPLFVFGLGLAVGYLAHKYRKEILASVSGLTDTGAGHDNLEDLAGECEECAKAE